MFSAFRVIYFKDFSSYKHSKPLFSTGTTFSTYKSDAINQVEKKLVSSFTFSYVTFNKMSVRVESFIFDFMRRLLPHDVDLPYPHRSRVTSVTFFVSWQLECPVTHDLVGNFNSIFLFPSPFSVCRQLWKLLTSPFVSACVQQFCTA
jgi:hypothetical protein